MLTQADTHPSVCCFRLTTVITVVAVQKHTAPLATDAHRRTAVADADVAEAQSANACAKSASASVSQAARGGAGRRGVERSGAEVMRAMQCETEVLCADMLCRMHCLPRMCEEESEEEEEVRANE